MENWITVATFTYPTEVALIKSYLEAEGIAFNVKDELAIQADNFLSNAIGGVKLQVKPDDVERVKQIVIEFGFTPEQGFVPSRFWTKFDAVTSGFPLMNNWRIELRFFFLSAFLLMLVATSIYIISRPTLEEELLENRWCLNYIEHEGKKYIPRTNNLSIIGLFNCDENIWMRDRNRVVLPGFETSSVDAYWDLKDEKIVISDPSNLESVYAGEYEIEKSFDEMILTSENTILHCSKATSYGGY